MKGFIIDCNYVIRVSKLMEIASLPRPSKKQNHLRLDDEVLPIVTVTIGVFE